ncbi:MAG: hypothetical protein ACUVT7_00610 [Thermoplasmata archaeon]
MTAPPAAPPSPPVTRTLVAERKVARPEDFDYRDIPKKMKFDYEHALKDQTGRAIEGVHALMQHLEKSQVDVRKLMQEAGNLIYRQFGIMNVGLGLRGPDGLYRYDVLVGFRDDAVERRKSTAYRKEEFYDAGPYKGYWLSKYTKLYLSEDHPWANSETNAYNRPILLGSKRRAVNEAIEGDYIDIHIFDGNDDLLGWIEISGTRTGFLPDVTTIRWIEIIGSIIGAAVRLQRAR